MINTTTVKNQKGGNKMRSSIFIGLLFIADSINSGILVINEAKVKFIAFAMISFIVMDLIEFINKNLRKNP